MKPKLQARKPDATGGTFAARESDRRKRVASGMTSAAPAPYLQRLHVMLAFVAGFADVTGFVALSGLFTAHVTGNFVLLGAEIVRGSAQGVIGKLLALPVFMLAVATTAVLTGRMAGRVRAPLRPLLALQALFMALFLVLGRAATPVSDADALLPLLAGMAGVFAMGVQNAVSRTTLAGNTPTTVMTGNTTQLVIDLLKLRDPAQRGAAQAALVRVAPVIAAFAIGAILGAVLYTTLGFVGLTLPVLLLAGFALTAPTET